MSVAVRCRRADYIHLGIVALLFCVPHVARGGSVRYSDEEVTRNFSLPSQTKELLALLAEREQIKVITQGPSIGATLSTSNLQLNGFLPITRGQLAVECGFEAFNWVQFITGIPSSWTYKVNAGGPPAPQPILDPIMNYPANKYVVYNSNLDRTITINYRDPDREIISRDNHQPYYDLADLQTWPNDPLYRYKNFGDTPYRQAGWFGENEYMHFLTGLVGVDENNDIIGVWDGIGTNFTWKTDAVSASCTSCDFSFPESPIPDDISGGVFDVVQDFAVAGDFNADGNVDAADYVVWRKGLGTTYTPDDYVDWRGNFGRTAGIGLGLTRMVSSNAGVPEPDTLLLLLLSWPIAWLNVGRTAVNSPAPCSRAIQPVP
jgi:hypothetical protein